MNEIKFNDFLNVELKVGEIKSAELVVDTDKLLRLEVDLGEEKLRQIIAGLAKFFDPDELVGTRCAFVTNLEPRFIKGLESQGMILAASFEESLSVLKIDKSIPLGTRIS